MNKPALELTRELISRASVTPNDAGCQDLLAKRLEQSGFKCHRLPRGEVDNLWAVAGDDSNGPLVCLAGHTDVVPPGDTVAWRFDPFTPTTEGGWLYGRGAADMKTGVAAAVCAAEAFRRRRPNHRGRLAVLLTSDEEGPAIEGTQAVVDWLTMHDTRIDYCIVGEPSSTHTLGDTLRVGRRGSLNAHFDVSGQQGHVAYPDAADNAAHRLTGLLAELAKIRWDNGDDYFPPTSFQVSNIAAGTGADNVIPGRATADCNWRFNTAWSTSKLQTEIEQRCHAHGIAPEAIDWRCSGEPFITKHGTLIETAMRAIYDKTGHTPKLSTGGGTSDARYIAPTGAEVVEIGPVNATIHQVDERVTLEEPDALAGIYERIFSELLD